MMYCPQIRNLLRSYISCLDDSSLPQVPPDANAPGKTFVVHNRYSWDLDPTTKSEGINHVDNYALNFVEKHHLPQPQMAELIANGTRSCSDPALREQGLKDLVDADEPPWFDCPDEVSPFLDEAIEMQLDKFKLRNASLTPLPQCRFPKSHPAGIGYTGTKEENFSRAINQAKSLTKNIAAHGFNYLSYHRYAGISRTQTSIKPNTKLRLIWFCPFVLLLLQLQIWQFASDAWLAHPKQTSTFYGLDLQTATQYFHEHIADLGPEELVYMNGDYPSFDIGRKLETETYGLRYAHGVQPWEYRYLAKLLLKAFFSKALRQQEQFMIALLVAIFLHSAVYKRIQIGPNLWHVIGLMASGNAYTYIADTLLCDLRDFLLLKTLQIRRLPRLFGGDDSFMLFYARDFDVEKLARQMVRLFRTTWQTPPKCTIARNPEDVKYHGRQWLTFNWYRPIAVLYHLLFFRERSSLTLFPEPFVASGRADAAIAYGRALSLFDDSGRRYPFLLRLAAKIADLIPGLEPRTDSKPEFYSLDSLFATH